MAQAHIWRRHTPRGDIQPLKTGKTISVSMFAAAMIFAVPNLECSIYSTCKRISHKLLRNIDKFLQLIHAELGIPHYRVIRWAHHGTPPYTTGGES